MDEKYWKKKIVESIKQTWKKGLITTSQTKELVEKIKKA